MAPLLKKLLETAPQAVQDKWTITLQVFAIAPGAEKILKAYKDLGDIGNCVAKDPDGVKLAGLVSKKTEIAELNAKGVVSGSMQSSVRFVEAAAATFRHLQAIMIGVCSKAELSVTINPATRYV